MKRIFNFLLAISMIDGVAIGQKIPFEFDRHMYVQAIFNDSDTTKLLFDTGASGIYLDKDYLASIGVPLIPGEESPHRRRVTVSGAGAASMVASFAKSLKVQMGDSVYNLEWPRALALDSAMGSVLGRRFDGIVGWDLFKREALSINFERSEMEVLSKVDLDRRYPGPGWIPYKIVNNKINIPATIHLSDGSSIETGSLIDLGGYHSLILTSEFCEEHGVFDKVGKHIPWENPRAGVGGKFSSSYCRLAGVTLGNQRVELPVAQLSRNKTGELAVNDYGANLGNTLLNRYTLVFDFVDTKVKLIPNSRAGEPFVFTKTGLWIGYDRATHSLVIRRVIENSSGEKAGIKPGDQLVTLEGKEALSYGFYGAQNYLRLGKDGRVTLTFVREGKEMTKEVPAIDVL